VLILVFFFLGGGDKSSTANKHVKETKIKYKNKDEIEGALAIIYNLLRKGKGKENKIPS
jgi:hypothetical protein